ncbi:hypothetical protein UY3_13682 [Chelonia mydas]|uniref:Uncharacterized protein n=1 Tax=Chelonia mydas TaxID=8469 RepID=M7BLX2_CHEMY|nr:hypothetical protein UY3_13682 [Chelonia mydas]
MQKAASKLKLEHEQRRAESRLLEKQKNAELEKEAKERNAELEREAAERLKEADERKGLVEGKWLLRKRLPDLDSKSKKQGKNSRNCILLQVQFITMLIFVLTCVYLAALSLRWVQLPELLPLFLLSLADFLAALVLIITAAIQLLPAQLFVLAYEFCPYGLMLALMFYAISFLMVIVYAYEVNRTIRGWRVTHMTAPQERRRCTERAQHCLPYALAWVKLWCRRNSEVRLMYMENDGFASRNIQSVCKISRCFQLVFLICWTPAFLLSILSFTSIEPASIFALHVAMALTMSLQGLLHSLVYGWLRQNFRQEALGETLPLRYYPGLKACYDESFGVEC